MRAKILRLTVLAIIALLGVYSAVSGGDVSALLEKAVVLISHSSPGVKNALGSGFLVSPDGLVVTADHVISDETKGGVVYPTLFAQRYSGAGLESYELSVVRRLRRNGRGPDIAILRVAAPPPDSLPFLEVGDAPSIGDHVLIAGFPLVFDKVYAYPLLREGIIASTRYVYEDAPIIMLDLTGVSGYSGSPVLDRESGTVVGVIRGQPQAHPETNFSVAFLLRRHDIAVRD